MVAKIIEIQICKQVYVVWQTVKKDKYKQAIYYTGYNNTALFDLFGTVFVFAQVDEHRYSLDGRFLFSNIIFLDIISSAITGIR